MIEILSSTELIMKEEIKKILSPLFGQKCTIVRVGEYKSLSFGFGEIKWPHLDHPRIKHIFKSEWEIGAYHSDWRVIKNNQIILGSRDSYEWTELDPKIRLIDFDEIITIENLSLFDVRVVFRNNLIVDFLATMSHDDDDELFHIFCPDHVYIELDSNGVWKCGRSDQPRVS